MTYTVSLKNQIFHLNPKYHVTRKNIPDQHAIQQREKAYKYAVSFSWADNIGGVYKTSAFGSSGSCKGLLTPFRRMPRLRDPCLI